MKSRSEKRRVSEVKGQAPDTFRIILMSEVSGPTATSVRGVRFTHLLDARLIRFGLHDGFGNGDVHRYQRHVVVTHIKTGAIVGDFVLDAGVSAVAEARRLLNALRSPAREMCADAEQALGKTIVARSLWVAAQRLQHLEGEVARLTAETQAAQAGGCP